MSICFPQFILKVEFERSDFMIKSINEIIKELRVENGITQSELADKLGCKRQKIADWEREKASPSINDLIPLSEVFNVSIDYLMGITDVKTTDIDIKNICEYTGLNENSVSILHEIYTSSIDNICEYFDIVNKSITSLYIFEMALFIQRYHKSLSQKYKIEKEKKLISPIPIEITKENKQEWKTRFAHHLEISNKIMQIDEKADICMFRLQENIKEFAKTYCKSTLDKLNNQNKF